MSELESATADGRAGDGVALEPVAEDPGPATGPEPEVPGATEDLIPREQRVTWGELFFDVVWVFAVTQLSDSLAHAHGPGGAAKALLLLVPLWWCWVGATVLGNTAGDAVDSTRGRMVLFALAGCGLVMSVGIPRAYESGDHGGAVLFALAYLALRAGLWAALRTRPEFAGTPWNPFTAALATAAPLFLLGAVLEGPARVTVWAAAAAADILAWVLLSSKLCRIRFETAHLPERFGLFLIIALGETVMAIGTQASSHPFTAPELASLAVGFVLILLLWWTYFHFGAPAARHSLETDPRQSRIVREIFTYCHALYVTSIIFVAVGLKKLMAHPLDAPEGTPALLLAPGIALFLLTFCYSRWQMFGGVGTIRFCGGVAAVVLACLAPLLPGIVVAALGAAILSTVNVSEAYVVGSGRTIPLLNLPSFRGR
ncbi:low temperature requirement protein A [Yinghuangia seranimata]|uniref:low temperature requirement protein A n=1 Tax=Yinghuangia seranimata TaxID=408067 RepID=UPI00248C1588|nr:low temperature requirement protein A [Yinghuangia seranimata]MDI2131096.1 low temperature requirement protein A [Yinghuangia seranimata]